MNTTALISEKTQKGLEAIIDLQRYNSLHKVIRITAWVYRFVNNARLKVVSNDRIYTVERPLQKLCLLELYAEELTVKEDNVDENEPLRRST